jgi:hypothetical protein
MLLHFSHENQQFFEKFKELPKTSDLFALRSSLEEALPFGHLQQLPHQIARQCTRDKKEVLSISFVSSFITTLGNSYGINLNCYLLLCQNG